MARDFTTQSSNKFFTTSLGKYTMAITVMNNPFKTAILGMQNHLLAVAMKLTLNHDDAQDLVQETTLKALYNEEKFVEDTNLKGWMMTIMRNIFINNYRQGQRKATVVDQSVDLFMINAAQTKSVDGPEGAIAVEEISKLIAMMPKDYAEPFSLHIQGYKYEEISQKLAMPIGTVKSHIFFTRKRLRELLKDYR